jgi:hypothetical protein
VHSFECVEELMRALRGLLIASGHEYLERYNIEFNEEDISNTDTSNPY